MLEIAHRGYSEIHPDNTLTAFKAAVANGFDMIEVDIQLCETGEIVCFHDLFLNGSLIKTLSLKDLGEKCPSILTLNEFFKEINTNEIGVVLDMKGGDNLAKELLKFLKKRRSIINFDNLYISSYNENHTMELDKSMLPLKLGIITDNKFSLPEFGNIHFVSIYWPMVDEKLIKYCRAAGIKIFIFSIKEMNQYNFVKHLKVDGIITNCKLPLFKLKKNIGNFKINLSV